jgi:hypothetical protein
MSSNNQYQINNYIKLAWPTASDTDKKALIDSSPVFSQLQSMYTSRNAFGFY